MHVRVLVRERVRYVCNASATCVGVHVGVCVCVLHLGVCVCVMHVCVMHLEQDFSLSAPSFSLFLFELSLSVPLVGSSFLNLPLCCHCLVWPLSLYTHTNMGAHVHTHRRTRTQTQIQTRTHVEMDGD